MEQNIQRQYSSYAAYIAAISLSSWMIYGIVYRLYFHPLAKFPGPKLGIITYWFEFWHDVVRRGKYTWKIKDLHAEYGPIIRINPDELHIDDPDYYDEVFVGAQRRSEKPKRAAQVFGPKQTFFATTNHELHRLRRAPFNPYFSKRSISQYSPVVQGVIDKLCERLQEAEKTGEPVNLQYAYAAMTTDVINEYCFAQTRNAVLLPDFNKDHYDKTMELSEMAHSFKQFPWLFSALESLPDWLIKATNPGIFNVFLDMKSYAITVDDLKAGKTLDAESSGHQTLFYELLKSDLAPEEKDSERLGDVAFTLIAAGTYTTAHFLKITSYHIVANTGIRQNLLREIETVVAVPGTPAYLQELEKLKYLTAIINEGLRLSYGTSSRICRASPDRSLDFHGTEIPVGTPINMSTVLMHDNSDIFPEPSVFRPERWLQGDHQKLQKYLVTFSKGTRMCVGMNLAYAEMYLTLASVFRNFNFDLSDVIRERDIDVTYDWINTKAALDSKGMITKVIPAS